MNKSIVNMVRLVKQYATWVPKKQEVYSPDPVITDGLIEEELEYRKNGPRYKQEEATA
jgi:hypothetical protein